MQKENFTADMEKYFGIIDENVKTAYDLAKIARKKGLDPEDDIDLPLKLG